MKNNNFSAHEHLFRNLYRKDKSSKEKGKLILATLKPKCANPFLLQYFSSDRKIERDRNKKRTFLTSTMCSFRCCRFFFSVSGDCIGGRERREGVKSRPVITLQLVVIGTFLAIKI